MDERYIQKRVHEILKGRIAMGGGEGVRAGAMTDWVEFVKLFRDIAEDAGHAISYKTAMELAGPVWEKLKGEGLAGGARKKKAAPRRRAAGSHDYLVEDAVCDMFHHAPATTREEVFDILCESEAAGEGVRRRARAKPRASGVMAGTKPRVKPRAPRRAAGVKPRAPRRRTAGEGVLAPPMGARLPRKPVSLVY